MFTLLTHDRHGIFDGARTRILTPLEYERLQGFPDGWTKEGKKEDGSVVPVSDTQRYKCLGNAVTVPVVSAVARAMFPDRRTRGQK